VAIVSERGSIQGQVIKEALASINTTFLVEHRIIEVPMKATPEPLFHTSVLPELVALILALLTRITRAIKVLNSPGRSRAISPIATLLNLRIRTIMRTKIPRNNSDSNPL